MRWSEQQYKEYLAKTWPKMFEGTARENDEPDPGPESVLQGKITKWAKDNGHPCLSFRQSRKAKGFIPIGWPDITLFLPEGRVVLIELKSATGELRKEQKELRMIFNYLNHEYHKIKSFKRFLEVING